MKQPVKRILPMHRPYQASAGCTVVLLVFLTNLQRAPSLASQKPGYGCKTQLFCLFFRSPTRTKLLRNNKKESAKNRKAPKNAARPPHPPTTARLSHRNFDRGALALLEMGRGHPGGARRPEGDAHRRGAAGGIRPAQGFGRQLLGGRGGVQG